ncbi:hypothetical protein D3C79_890860 [compost metagenome]
MNLARENLRADGGGLGHGAQRGHQLADVAGHAVGRAVQAAIGDALNQQDPNAAGRLVHNPQVLDHLVVAARGIQQVAIGPEHAWIVRVGLRYRETSGIQHFQGGRLQWDTVLVDRSIPQAEYGPGGHPHRTVRNADGGIGQAAGQHAQVVAVQLRDGHYPGC